MAQFGYRGGGFKSSRFETKGYIILGELLLKTFNFCTLSVKRLVKHTGYGNAAGLLARKGLMAGGTSSVANQYSADEDSDTEEYKQNAHM